MVILPNDQNSHWSSGIKTLHNILKYWSYPKISEKYFFLTIACHISLLNLIIDVVEIIFFNIMVDF